MPHDVADDQQRGAVGQVERVVPVAADLLVGGRRPVVDGYRQARRLRGRGKQARLQGLGYGSLPALEASGPRRATSTAVVICISVRRKVAGVEQREHAEGLFPGAAR